MNAKYIVAFFWSVGAFFGDISWHLLVIGLFLALDFITGIYKSYHNKVSITSRKMYRTAWKMLTYQFIMMTLYVMELKILNFGTSGTLTKFAGIYLMSIEFKSIIENLKIVGVDISELFSKFFKETNLDKKAPGQ